MDSRRTGAMTQSLEDYLEAIFVLIDDGRPAQVRDVARLLGDSDPTPENVARAAQTVADRR